MQILWGLLIPFLGTTLGAACVFFLKSNMPELVRRGLTGFAAGVMVAASIWSLLILDLIIPHLHMGANQAEGLKTTLDRDAMMVLAVILHNIPEGIAVGVVYAGLLSGENGITVTEALPLSLGIAIQNFPEGAIISTPLRSEGMGNLHGACSPARWSRWAHWRLLLLRGWLARPCPICSALPPEP